MKNCLAIMAVACQCRAAYTGCEMGMNAIIRCVSSCANHTTSSTKQREPRKKQRPTIDDLTAYWKDTFHF